MPVGGAWQDYIHCSYGQHVKIYCYSGRRQEYNTYQLLPFGALADIIVMLRLSQIDGREMRAHLDVAVG